MARSDDCVKLYDVGDELYRVCHVHKSKELHIEKIKIVQVDCYPHYVYRDNNGHSYFNHTIKKSCFETKEEAQAEIQTQYNKAEKRELLRKYERELNERFNICDHYIVK